MSRGRRTCRGKHRFRDHREATAALHRIQTSSKRAKKPKRAYPCSHCRGWHLTSEDKRDLMRRAQLDRER